MCYVNNEDNATFLVARGLGVSILPHSPEPTYPGQVVRVPIEPPVYHELALAVRDLQEAPPAVRRFVRFAREWFSAREERKRGLNFFRVICEKITAVLVQKIQIVFSVLQFSR